MYFFGEYSVSFSGKGRLVVPKKILSAIGTSEEFTLTKGFDSCLAGYRDTDWKKATEELLSISITNNKNFDLKRHMFSSAVELVVDEQGRVVVPQNLLQYADLSDKKQAVIIGVGDHFEIWEEKKWLEYVKKIDPVINKKEE